MENENTTLSTVLPTSFWVIVGLFLIWNLLGVFHYLQSVYTTVESLVSQGMTIEQAEYFLNVPTYFYAVFALGTWSGLLGAVFMLLRKAWAAHVFLFSAVMVIVSFILEAENGGFSVLGAIYLVIMIFTLIVALFEAWYSKRMKALGILQ